MLQTITKTGSSYGTYYYYNPLDFFTYSLGLPLLGRVCRFGQA
ncbi:MAG: hypothetical protein AAFY45_06985 [Bacteroidota bacterium]